MDTPIVALRMLGATVSATAYDNNPDMQTVIQDAHGTSGDTAFAGQTGDITKIPSDDFEDVDVVVASPPCPPWSRNGKGHGRETHHKHAIPPTKKNNEMPGGRFGFRQKAVAGRLDFTSWAAARCPPGS